MRTLIKIKLLSILLTISPFGFAAEEVTEEISKLRRWSAYKVVDHSAWGTEACIASSPGKESIVEVYAQQVDGEFAEPTVQVLFADIGKQVYSATMQTDRTRPIKMTLASSPQDADMRAVMVRLKDRAKIIEDIRKFNKLTVKLKNAKNRTIKTLSFSLSGSGKTVQKQFEKCGLEFSEIK